MRSAFFWDFTQHRLIILYHSMLCEIPEERRSHLHRSGSLKSHTTIPCFVVFVCSGSSVHLRAACLLCLDLTQRCFKLTQMLFSWAVLDQEHCCNNHLVYNVHILYCQWCRFLPVFDRVAMLIAGSISNHSTGQKLYVHIHSVKWIQNVHKFCAQRTSNYWN